MDCFGKIKKGAERELSIKIEAVLTLLEDASCLTVKPYCELSSRQYSMAEILSGNESFKRRV